LDHTSSKTDKKEFERRFDKNVMMTQTLSKAEIVYTFYKNFTDSIYFLGIERINYSSINAKFTISLTKGDGKVATETYTYKLFKELLKTQSLHNLQDDVGTSSESFQTYTEYFLDFFNVLSTSSDMVDPSIYKSLQFNVDDIFQMDDVGNITIQGELINHSFSYSDNVFCAAYATPNKLMLLYFDLNDFNLSNTIEYEFEDMTLITSLTCGKDFVVYSKLFDKYNLRLLTLDHKTNKFSEKCHGEVRDGLYESTYLSYFKANDSTIILNSKIKDISGVKYIDLEALEGESNDFACMIKNHSLFEKKLDVTINFTLKLDIVNETYTIESAHSGKSFMLSPDRLSVLSVYWNNSTSQYEYFTSFKRETELISLVANTEENDFAVVYIQDENQLFLIDRKIENKNYDVQEAQHKILTSSIFGITDSTRIKSIRVENINRGQYNETILLCLFDSGVFASFDISDIREGF